MADLAESPTSPGLHQPVSIDLDAAGVAPEARAAVRDQLMLAALLLGFGRLVATGVHRAKAWLATDWRRSAIAAMSAIILLLVGLIVHEIGKEPIVVAPTDNVDTTTVARNDHIVVSGDSFRSLAADAGIDWHDMVSANLELVHENTAWCNARPTSDAYRRGFLEDGKTPRDGTFCKLFHWDATGEMLALETLRLGQRVHYPPRDLLADTTTK